MLESSIARINSVIDFIEQHLNDDLSLKVLAKYANYSDFHFHRMFSLLKGETPHAFVQRKRVEQIAWQLMKEKNMTIKDLALKNGFDSPVSFAKAFKKFYGVSASQLRKMSTSHFNKIVRQESKIGKEQVAVEDYFQRMEKVEEWMRTRGEINEVWFPKMALAAIRCQGNFDLSTQAFRQLRNWIVKKGMAEGSSRKWLMVIHDNPAITETEKVNHSACVEVDDGSCIDPSVNYFEIPAGRFLVGTFNIEASEFKMAWGGTAISLMRRGHQYRDGYYFELFHSDSVFEPTAHHQVSVCIPIA